MKNKTLNINKALKMSSAELAEYILTHDEAIKNMPLLIKLKFINSIQHSALIKHVLYLSVTSKDFKDIPEINTDDFNEIIKRYRLRKR